jgi:hypothetical protein
MKTLKLEQITELLKRIEPVVEKDNGYSVFSPEQLTEEDAVILRAIGYRVDFSSGYVGDGYEPGEDDCWYVERIES